MCVIIIYVYILGCCCTFLWLCAVAFIIRWQLKSATHLATRKKLGTDKRGGLCAFECLHSPPLLSVPDFCMVAKWVALFTRHLIVLSLSVPVSHCCKLSYVYICAPCLSGVQTGKFISILLMIHMYYDILAHFKGIQLQYNHRCREIFSLFHSFEGVIGILWIIFLLMMDTIPIPIVGTSWKITRSAEFTVAMVWNTAGMYIALVRACLSTPLWSSAEININPTAILRKQTCIHVAVPAEGLYFSGVGLNLCVKPSTHAGSDLRAGHSKQNGIPIQTHKALSQHRRWLACTRFHRLPSLHDAEANINITCLLVCVWQHTFQTPNLSKFLPK